MSEGRGLAEAAPGDAAWPAFGTADLSNCEREQIHLAGSIQPHGALLVLDGPELLVVQASANAAEFLGLPEVLGRPAAALGGDLAERIRPHLEDPLDAIPAAIRCRAGDAAQAFDGMLHRPPEGGLVLELEPAGPPVDLARHVEGAMQALLATYSLRALCDAAARAFRDLTGYDRVMVYRFDEDGHGEVFAEERRDGLETLLGNRYPASDIPQIARRLYERNRVRVLVDVGYRPVPLVPRLSPLTGRELDMSLCVLRSVSPIHVQYLQNMGVDATLVASVLVGGRLWGLVACHHYAPREARFATRAVCELLAEALGTRIAALESFVQAQAEIAVRRLEQRMIEAITREGDWRGALFDTSPTLLHPVGATGAALLFEGQVLTAGEVPATAELRALGHWLEGRDRAPVVATSTLARLAPAFAALMPVASGLLAVPVSTVAGEWLLWFRPEQVRTVTWGGMPFKPIPIGDDPAELSPRRSFAKWHQVVQGSAEPWTPRDLAAARLIGETVTDVVLQFRAVRTLIAQDQLDQVRRQVAASDQPVVILDPHGRIQLTNDAFEALMPPAVAGARRVDDLLPAFAEPAELRRRLRDVLENRRSWRGELRVQGPTGEVPLLVRADPVLSAPDRVLGFVFLFTDLAGRKAVDQARRRFQERILDRQRPRAGRLDGPADLVFRGLLATVVENAQLAALEVTDGGDPAGMPAMLESLRDSVARTAAVLEVLIAHAARAGDPPAPGDAP